MELIGSSRLFYLADRIKFLHGVWLPSLSAEQIDSIPIPPEGDRAIVFGTEALDNPLPYIEALFSLNVRSGVITNLTENESERLIMEILCPEFNVFPSANFDTDLKHRAFYRMLNEQAGILNFLSEQRTVVINGAAGTGKTLIAVEKARRHAAAGGHVLFLCYNAELKKYLISCYGHCMIDFMTLDGYVCRLCGTASADYGIAEKKLKDYAAFGAFRINMLLWTRDRILVGMPLKRQEFFGCFMMPLWLYRIMILHFMYSTTGFRQFNPIKFQSSSGKLTVS